MRIASHEVLLSILAFLFAALTIRAYLIGDTLQKCIFKPLAMLCIIAIAFLQPDTEPTYYKIAILNGPGNRKQIYAFV